jgi:hypothetical protein
MMQGLDEAVKKEYVIFKNRLDLIDEPWNV